MWPLCPSSISWWLWLGGTGRHPAGPGSSMHFRFMCTRPSSPCDCLEGCQKCPLCGFFFPCEPEKGILIPPSLRDTHVFFRSPSLVRSDEQSFPVAQVEHHPFALCLCRSRNPLLCRGLGEEGQQLPAEPAPRQEVLPHRPSQILWLEHPHRHTLLAIA